MHCLLKLWRKGGGSALKGRMGSREFLGGGGNLNFGEQSYINFIQKGEVKATPLGKGGGKKKISAFKKAEFVMRGNTWFTSKGGVWLTKKEELSGGGGELLYFLSEKKEGAVYLLLKKRKKEIKSERGEFRGCVTHNGRRSGGSLHAGGERAGHRAPRT